VGIEGTRLTFLDTINSNNQFEDDEHIKQVDSLIRNFDLYTRSDFQKFINKYITRYFRVNVEKEVVGLIQDNGIRELFENMELEKMQ
jgi:ferritin-like protein